MALEAAAFNLPVFGTNVGIMGELFPQEVLADPNNEEEIISLIRSFVPLAENLDVSALTSRFSASGTKLRINEIISSSLLGSAKTSCGNNSPIIPTLVPNTGKLNAAASRATLGPPSLELVIIKPFALL